MLVQSNVAEIIVTSWAKNRATKSSLFRFNAYLKLPPGLEEHWEFTVSGDEEAWTDGIWTSGGDGASAWSPSKQEKLES